MISSVLITLFVSASPLVAAPGTIAIAGQDGTLAASAVFSVAGSGLSISGGAGAVTAAAILTSGGDRLALVGGSSTIFTFAPARPPDGRVVVVPAF